MTTKKVSMTPTPFEPQRLNHWIFECGVIEPYLVKEVVLPKITCADDYEVDIDDIVISCYNTHGCDINEKIYHWMRSDERSVNATLKYVDPSGKVTETWKMRVRPYEFWCDPLTYDSAGPVLTHVRFVCSSVTILCEPVKPKIVSRKKK